MVTIKTLRKLALSFPEANEEVHFNKISFTVKKKIFCTYEEIKNTACIKLTENDQDIYSCAENNTIFPVENKWGKKGWTIIDLNNVSKKLFIEALRSAYCTVANKKLADQIKKEN